ncbi:hypothetical protein Cma02nite_15180 [Cellulomonas marina]|nr:hypothetical protein Cma02nite_15180 [Cellulomonas marina]
MQAAAPAAATTAALPASTTALRNPGMHPFASSAVWNTSMGSGAKFESSTSTRTAQILSGVPVVNSSRWSIAVFRAKSTDPTQKVTNTKTGAVYWLKMPSGTAPTYGTDKHVAVVDVNGYTGWEFYKMTKVATNTWTTTRVVKTDLRVNGMADGARASGVSIFAGLIRADELRARSIRHTLALGIPDSMLKYGQVWPARTQDSSAATTYSGSVPMGTMVAIPPSVDVTKLGLTADGLALAKALQNYGAHVLIRSSTVALYCEAACDPTQASNIHNDFKKIIKQVRVVTNNTPTTVSGGGTRRVATLPGLTS